MNNGEKILLLANELKNEFNLKGIFTINPYDNMFKFDTNIFEKVFKLYYNSNYILSVNETIKLKNDHSLDSLLKKRIMDNLFYQKILVTSQHLTIKKRKNV